MKKTNERKRRRRGGERGKNSSKVRGNGRHAKFSCKRQPQQEQERSKTIAESPWSMRQDDRGRRGGEEETTWQRSDEKRLKEKEGEKRRVQTRTRRAKREEQRRKRGGHSGAGVQRVMVIASEYTTSSEGAPMCPQKRRSSRSAWKGCEGATKKRRARGKREREGERTTTGRGQELTWKRM